MPLPVPEALAAMEVEDDTAGGNVFSDDGSQVTVRNTFVQVGQVTPVRVRARALRRHGTDGTDSPVPGNISAGASISGEHCGGESLSSGATQAAPSRRSPRSTPRRRSRRPQGGMDVTPVIINFEELCLDPGVRMDQDAGVPLNVARQAGANRTQSEVGADALAATSGGEQNVGGAAVGGVRGRAVAASPGGGAPAGSPDPLGGDMASQAIPGRCGFDLAQPLRCAGCAKSKPFQAKDSGGLLIHMVRMHSGVPLVADQVAQLAFLNKGMCETCGTVRGRQVRVCTWCNKTTKLRNLCCGDVVPDRSAAQRIGAGRSSQPDEVKTDEAGPEQGGASGSQPAGHSGDSQGTDASQDYAGGGAVGQGVRSVAAPVGWAQHGDSLPRYTDEHVPISVVSKFGASWEEAIRGARSGCPHWSLLAQYRCRYLLAPVPDGFDRADELKKRLRMWERGHFVGLMHRIAAQVFAAEGRVPTSGVLTEEQRASRALALVRQDGIAKALKSLCGGIAAGDAEQQQQWLTALVPTARCDVEFRPSEQFCADARAKAFGFDGDLTKARQHLRPRRGPTGAKGIPWVTLDSKSAPGPSGERASHLRDIMDHASCGVRRRMRRSLDLMAEDWALGELPGSMRWLLDTGCIFLQKPVKVAVTRDGDDDAWLAEGADEPTDRQFVEVAAPASRSASTSEPPKKPRPIQCGEFLRKLCSKRLLKFNQTHVRAVVTSLRQWGVGISGGAESIAHIHNQLDKAWRAGKLKGPLMVIQVDEENFFGSVDWQASRAATASRLPDRSSSIAWKQSHESRVVSSEGAKAVKTRGAEQGDVDGPLEASLVLGGVACRARQSTHELQCGGVLPWPAGADAAEAEEGVRATAVAASTWRTSSSGVERDDRFSHPLDAVAAGGGIADVWYIDDGTVVCDPALGFQYLTQFDRSSRETGCSRHLGKSLAILYASDAEIATNRVQWCLDDLAHIATITKPDDDIICLGAPIGSLSWKLRYLAEKGKVVAAMHKKIETLDRAQDEFVLAKAALGVSKLTHVARCAGLDLAGNAQALGEFDGYMQSHLARWCPGLDETCVEQSSFRVACGGLGLRSFADLVLPAGIAGAVQSLPMVKTFDDALVRAGLTDGDILSQGLAGDLNRAVARFGGTLHTAEAAQVEALVASVWAHTSAEWSAGGDTGSRGPEGVLPQASWPDLFDPQAGGAGAACDEEGDEDDRGPVQAGAGKHLQRQLCLLRDATRCRAHVASLEAAGRWAQVRRLKTLGRSEVSHQWLHHTNPHEGKVLDDDDWKIAVAKRLGAKLTEEEFSCHVCGTLVDCRHDHSEVCGLAAATKGHYAIVSSIAEVASLGDSGLQTEARGLLEHNPRRPADIYTRIAYPGVDAALDVTVTAVEAYGAGEEPCARAYRSKLRSYKKEIPEMRANGIRFVPLVWSCEGSSHPETIRSLHNIADGVARKTGCSAKKLLRRLWHNVTVDLMRRRAAMARSVRPPLSEEQWQLLTGNRGFEASACERLEVEADEAGGAEGGDAVDAS